jgi:hypothetical protein
MTENEHLYIGINENLKALTWIKCFDKEINSETREKGDVTSSLCVVEITVCNGWNVAQRKMQL